MTQSIHGHEIMKLVAEAEQPMTRDELVAEAAARFGEDATYHACAGGDWSLDELLAFLASRGKVVSTPDGRLTTDIGLMCSHE